MEIKRQLYCNYTLYWRSIFLRSMVCFILVFNLSTLQAQTDDRSWSSVGKPTKERRAQSIGKYSSGCLRGAAILPKSGEGYQVMRLSRKRYYCHPDLIRFIEKLGKIASTQAFGTLLLGDLGMARGGPFLNGHRSHQTGLDVDIWYRFIPITDKRDLNISDRETFDAPSVLTDKANAVNPGYWSLTNENILEAAASLPEVDRIFVNARIKQALCERKLPQDRLQKIRPWFAHADHFHVRLKCPADDILCEKQEPAPAGSGCGADLAWWLSAQAQIPSKKPGEQRVLLPKECDSVLSEQ